jgi:hypothetical protein
MSASLSENVPNDVSVDCPFLRCCDGVNGDNVAMVDDPGEGERSAMLETQSTLQAPMRTLIILTGKKMISRARIVHHGSYVRSTGLWGILRVNIVSFRMLRDNRRFRKAFLAPPKASGGYFDGAW